MVQDFHHFSFHPIDLSFQHDYDLLWALLVELQEVWTVLFVIKHIILENGTLAAKAVTEYRIDLLS